MSSEQIGFGGPYLSLAVICEKLLVEKDGVQSIVRIVDHFHVHGSPPDMPPMPVFFTLAIAFKSGFFRGVQRINIEPTTPSGAKMPAMSTTVNFEGDDDRGVFVGMETRFVAPEPGLYWLDIKLGDMTATRVPLRISYYPTER